MLGIPPDSLVPARSVAEPNLFGAAVAPPRREHRKKGAHGGNMVSPVKRARGLGREQCEMGPPGFEPGTKGL